MLWCIFMHYDVANDIMWLKVWLRINVTQRKCLLVHIARFICLMLRCTHCTIVHCKYVSMNIELLLCCLMANIVVETNFFYFSPFDFALLLCVYIHIPNWWGWYLCELSTKKDICEHMYNVRFFPFFHIHLTLLTHHSGSTRGCFESIQISVFVIGIIIIESWKPLSYILNTERTRFSERKKVFSFGSTVNSISFTTNKTQTTHTSLRV